jgi:hypothetical protein
VSGRLVSAAAAALLGALASVVFLAGAYLLSPALRLDFAVDPPRLVTTVSASFDGEGESSRERRER